MTPSPEPVFSTATGWLTVGPAIINHGALVSARCKTSRTVAAHSASSVPTTSTTKASTYGGKAKLLGDYAPGTQQQREYF